MKAVVFGCFVWACVLLPLVQCQVAAPDKLCSLTRESPVKVSINSWRKESGQWISQVAVENRGGQNQLEAEESKQWQVDVESSSKLCESTESSLTIMLTLTAPPAGLAAGYELFPGIGRYKFHSGVETWARAREVCAEEGAHLAIINSEKEADVMKLIFARHPKIPGAVHNDWAWIGMYEGKVGGEYFTIFGSSGNSTGFTRWVPGQPSEVGSGTHLLVHRGTGGLGDTSTRDKESFFCERELL